jgi:class 3 adenylate cyclase
MQIHRTIQIAAPPERFWPLVAQTDRLNREMGLPPVAFTLRPQPEGGSRIDAEAKMGPLTFRYQEMPFEWVRGVWFREQRLFSQGPLRRVDMHVRFEPCREGTRMQVDVQIEPSGPMGEVVARAVGAKSMSDFLRTCRKFERYLLGETATPYPTHSTDSPVDERRMAQCCERLLLSGADTQTATRMADWLRTTTPQEAVMMRPFELADAWKLDRLTVLRTMLSAAARGVEMLEMRWRVLCPNCRGNMRPAARLSELEPTSHCEACNIRFDAAFDTNVEVFFRVAPAVRNVQAVTYCIGGPHLTPHRAAQFRLCSGADVKHTLEMAPNSYRITSPQRGELARLEIRHEGPEAVTLTCSTAQAADIEMCSGGTLRILNDTAHDILLCIDESAWVRDAATAAVVTSQQAFRDQFGSEVLSPGVEIGVEQVVVLFSDLKGSTAMYRDSGDAAGYAAVRDHFEAMRRTVRKHNGGIIKTIGDAVMAVFTDPVDAVSAALEIQQRPHSSLGRDSVKLGLHSGPAIAVTANDLLDYFGQTVNLAARLQAQSIGGDIVLSRHTAEDAGVADLLRRMAVSIHTECVEVRGFSSHIEMVRIDLQPQKRPEV